MGPAFTPDDVGKSVESAEGEMLGVVVAVDEANAYVEPAAEPVESLDDADGSRASTLSTDRRAPRRRELGRL